VHSTMIRVQGKRVIQGPGRWGPFPGGGGERLVLWAPRDVALLIQKHPLGPRNPKQLWKQVEKKNIERKKKRRERRPQM